MNTVFIAREKISLKDSKKIIFDNLRYSEYECRKIVKQYNIKDKKLEEMYEVATKENFLDAATKGRNYKYRHPIENAIDWNPNLRTEGERTFDIIEVYKGEEIVKDIPKNSDIVASVSYLSYFIDSLNLFNKAIETNEFVYFESALNVGFSALEASINEEVEKYNELHPKSIDINAKISFEEKIDEWIPILTDGKKIYKSNVFWNSYKNLQKFRNGRIQHPKKHRFYNYKEMCTLMNMYKHGIASFLFELDKIFNRRISSAIIRAKYFPLIEIENNI